MTNCPACAHFFCPLSARLKDREEDQGMITTADDDQKTVATVADD
jgi:hypothetical protein